MQTYKNINEINNEMKAIKNNPKYLLNDEAVILLLLSGILYIFNILDTVLGWVENLLWYVFPLSDNKVYKDK